MSILGDKQFGVEVAKHLDEERKRLSEWRDISTAPKDGTRALVWIDLRGEHITDRSYATIGCWDEFWGVWRDGHVGPQLRERPTHWMPLPPPPAPKGEGG